MDTRRFDILGIGDADMDLMVAVKNFPEAGQKSSGRLIGRYPGGMVANFLASAARFGARCAGILCVGDDAFGHESLDDLIGRGIDVSGSAIRKGQSTYFTTTCLAPDGEKRMILCFQDAVFPTPDEVDDAILASAQFVQMTGSHVKLSIPVAERARTLGTKVSFDLERLQSPMSEETKQKLLSLADIIFPNEEGLYSYSGCNSIEAGAMKLLSMGPSVVVVTKGADGAVGRDVAEQVNIGGVRIADKHSLLVRLYITARKAKNGGKKQEHSDTESALVHPPHLRPCAEAQNFRYSIPSLLYYTQPLISTKSVLFLP